MKLRMYRQEDCKEVTELFYHTVHTINEKDYTKEQLDVCPCRVSEQRSATAICEQLENQVQGNIIIHASITAKPFFEKRGYVVVKEQKVERQGIFLKNYVMEKKREE